MVLEVALDAPFPLNFHWLCESPRKWLGVTWSPFENQMALKKFMITNVCTCVTVWMVQLWYHEYHRIGFTLYSAHFPALKCIELKVLVHRRFIYFMLELKVVERMFRWTIHYLVVPFICYYYSMMWSFSDMHLLNII